MQNINQTKDQIKTLESLKQIVEALGDIATNKIKETRNQVKQNISFFKEITGIYLTLKKLGNQVRGLRQRVTNNKTILILVTSNTKFYGNLDSELVHFYIENTKKLTADRLIIGQEGIELLKATNFNIPYDKYILKKDIPDFEELKVLNNKVFEYEKILVFHTKFITVLNQIPTVTSIGANTINEKAPELPLNFIVEPELQEMIDFFESQILISLFQAIFFEVDIAHTAARMISMNQAEDSANKILKKEHRNLLDIRKSKINLEIIENYTSLMHTETNQ